MKNALLKILIFSLALNLSACSSIKIGWAATHTPGNMTARYIFFTGTERGTAELAEGETLVLNYDATLHSGSLSISVADPTGIQVWQVLARDNKNEEVKIPAGKPGLYEIMITGKNTRGDFAVAWTKNTARPPRKAVEDFYDWYLAALTDPARTGSILTDRIYRSNDLLTPGFVQKVDRLLDESESSGPGYDPFLCAQNVPPRLTVEDADVSGSSATVRVGYQSLTFTVYLAQMDGAWKIDNIACSFE